MLVYCWPCICSQDGLTHASIWMCAAALQKSLAEICEEVLTSSCSPISLRPFWCARRQEQPRHRAGTVWFQAIHIPQWDLTLTHQDRKSTSNPHWLQILLHPPFSHPRSGLQELLASNRTEYSGSVCMGVGAHEVTNHIWCPLISYALAQFPPRHPPGGLHTALSTKEERTKHWVQSWATISCSANCFQEILVLRLIAFSVYEGTNYNHWGMLINCFSSLQ